MKLLYKIFKWLVFSICTVILCWLIVCFVKYRLTNNDDIVEINGLVEYRYLELDFTNRQIFEELVGNKIVRIVGHPPFYVSEEHRENMWPENPHDMLDKNYTIKVTLTATPLKFGGWSKATVTSIEIVRTISRNVMCEITAMDKWLKIAEDSLAQAMHAAEDGRIISENLYMLAPHFYANNQNTNNERMIHEMIEANEKQVSYEWGVDKNSKAQYKFHFVSSYLYCFVVSNKIDEFKYDEIMGYVCSRMDLFTDDYEPEYDT